MRQIPISIARFAGRRTALYRWWAVNYIVLFFFVLPILAFVISIFSEEALVGKSAMSRYYESFIFNDNINYLFFIINHIV